MDMKVNVVYRGIVYRVRGIRILCSVITAVILLLLTLLGLGIWMLISAYGQDKFFPSTENKENLVSKNISSQINENPTAAPNISTSSLSSIDFNEPKEISTTEKIVTTQISNEAHKVLGHFQGLIPETNFDSPESKETTNEPVPDPPYEEFNDNFNDYYEDYLNYYDLLESENLDYPSVNTASSQEILKPEEPSTIAKNNWNPVKIIPDSVVEYSEMNPVYVVQSPNTFFQSSVPEINIPESIVTRIGELDYVAESSVETIQPDINSSTEQQLTSETQKSVAQDNTENQSNSSTIKTTQLPRISTLPPNINWQLKMGEILGLPQHMMPKQVQTTKYSSTKPPEYEDEESSQLFPSSRTDSFTQNSGYGGSESSSSFYPIKPDTTYPGLRNYSSSNNNSVVPNFNMKNKTISNTQSFPKYTQKPWYQHKIAISEANPPNRYAGPPVVGYGNKPYKRNDLNSTSDMLQHFWKVYNYSGTVPLLHEDRGPVPEDKPIHSFNTHSRIKFQSPSPPPDASVRGSVPYNRTRDVNPNRMLWTLDTTNINLSPSKGTMDNRNRRLKISEDVASLGSPVGKDFLNKLPSNRMQSSLHRIPQRNSGQQNYSPLINNGNLRLQNVQNPKRTTSETQGIISPPTKPSQLILNKMINQNANPRYPIRKQVIDNHRVRVRNQTKSWPNLGELFINPMASTQITDGPLQGIYDYSTRVANTLFNFPSEIMMLMKNSSGGYIDNALHLLQDYNKVFDFSNKPTGDDINENESHLMLPGIENVKLDPFEMSLVTWTFLDFWEFLIEKVGTLSSSDLQLLEKRLERNRLKKNNMMARTLVNEAIREIQVNRTFENLFLLPGFTPIFNSIKKLVRNETTQLQIDNGRMFDPFGLFNSQQRVQFMKLAVKVLLKFGKVYLNKSYALDCMMLLFCKELNQQTKKQGLDALSAKLKTVGLQVLTDRENRESDTINDIWRAISDYTPLQCDVMFPKCDGSKALEIVNDVASGSS